MTYTVSDLVRAVSDNYTGGYECCEMKILPNMERSEYVDAQGGRHWYLVIQVTDSEPGEYNIDGEYWFSYDNELISVREIPA